APLCASISSLSLHDALPILARDLVPLPPVSIDDEASRLVEVSLAGTDLPTVLTAAQKAGVSAEAILAGAVETIEGQQIGRLRFTDRKSTRLNSSHVSISYAV